MPRGFSKENRDNPRQPRAGRLAELPLSFPCFCTSELLAGLQNTPPGRQVPGSHVGKPQTVRLTENRWPFFRRGPRPGAWRVLCAGLGRPGPPLCIPRHTTASSHGCCACLSPRKEVCEAPPSRQTFTQRSHPKHSCLLSGPSLDPPSRQAPWEALASRYPPPPRETHPASSLLAAWRVDAACLCSAPWTSVTRESQLWPTCPPDMCLAPRASIPPQSLCNPPLGQRVTPNLPESYPISPHLGPSSCHGPAVPSGHSTSISSPLLWASCRAPTGSQPRAPIPLPLPSPPQPGLSQSFQRPLCLHRTPVPPSPVPRCAL